MKAMLHSPIFISTHDSLPMAAAADERKPLVTRFGDAVDVRNRGALRMSRFAGSQMRTTQDSPAVVRLWMDQQCHELSAHEARALAEQLLGAAALADQQNGH
jgi:hypothetical protein